MVKWDDIVNLSEKIYHEIIARGIKIDTLVPVLRGGAPLSLLLNRHMPDVDTACVHIKRSKTNSPNSDFGDPILKGITNESAIKGKNILIVEDIIDKGLSVDKAIEAIKRYNPQNVFVTTLFNFNDDKYKDIICGEKLESYVWIVFPWDGD